jgi:signal transduction histidine kinase
MPDYYHVPVLILTLLLLPGFGHLYLRFRDTRTLLWFSGFFFAIVRMVLSYMLEPSRFPESAHLWLAAAGQTSILISAALFLASLSPLRLRIGRFRILYAIPFALPLVAFSILLEGVFHGVAPSGPLFLVFPALGLVSVIVGIFWGAQDTSTPAWLGGGICGAAGAFALWVCFTQGASWSLTSVECSAHFVTALLLLLVYRRFSPGVFLSALGFAAWSLTVLELIPWIALNPTLDTYLVRFIVMGKVIAALGLILLALEDQLDINKSAQERERRARLELEAYTNLILSRRRVGDFDMQGPEICQTIVANSRFAQAALLLQSSGRFHLAGAAGLDKATARALGDLAGRIPATGFLSPGSAPLAVAHSQTLRLDLAPWLSPGDDLQRLRFTSALAVPMVGRTGTEGTLLLAGMRRSSDGDPIGPSKDTLRTDDLLPIEMLTARLQATRSQTMMLEKLIDSEKFAGLGQLAGNVTQQLNNPLTVILGYASLLEETAALDPQERKGVESILSEARRMRSTLESLTRISRPYGDQLTAVSVAELLGDMEQLHRPEFLHRSIEFRMSIAPALPKVQCSPQQLRQAVLHCLQFAIEAVDSQNVAPASTEPKTIRLEATSEGNLVQILVAHSGPGFLDPDRAFDPFFQSQATGETAGLGLSLCATILREHNGRASAVNFEPHGAAILLELQAA